MGQLILVRHGQASLGADDYDQLSELGQRQCRCLGDYLRERRRGFDAIYVGGLRRHAQSLAALADGYGAPLPAAALRPGLNEYDSEALIATVRPGPPVPVTTPEARRQHFRWLREGLHRWMAGDTQPAGLPPHAEFRAGVRAVLDEIRAQDAPRVLLVSSGGPIAAAVGEVLAAPAETTIELNLQIRNSALTEFVFDRHRHRLSSFNTVPHLDDPAREAWVSYA